MFETNDYTEKLVADIQAYALKHYNDSFYWSQIVECYTEAELLAELAIWDLDPTSATLADFRRAVEPLVDIYDDREADARNSAF